MSATPHLAELFATGKEVLIAYPGKPEITVWMQRPDPAEHELAVKKARSKRAARFHELTAEDSDEHMALVQETDAMDKEELVQAMVEQTTRVVETQALNDVLFSKDYGSDWGKEGEKWTDVLDALSVRLGEIDDRNKELKAANVEEGIIDAKTDPELDRLNKVQEKFEDETRTRRDEILEEKRGEIALNPIDRLREDLLTHRVSLECDLEWFATFKYEQLYYAIRYVDNRDQYYFKSPNQIKGLPPPIQDLLFEEFQQIDMDVGDLKNLPTPPLSSP
jgi:hypothetical protein